MTQPYKAKSGLTQYKPSQSWVEGVIQRDEMKGFCLACGKTVPNVEPDARRYECPSCHKPKVYGAEELLMMGLMHQ